ncbi:hypothetical protein C8F01DRAFT_1088736 [Mycena amicta]|nr:hypothetical protein C8F01DRAFT_1088736 [Mycena amicta]
MPVAPAPHPTLMQTTILAGSGSQVNVHDILAHATELEALFNAASSMDDSLAQPRCHPETQKEMLDLLYNWAAKETSGRSLHWLHRPAGAGRNFFPAWSRSSHTSQKSNFAT